MAALGGKLPVCFLAVGERSGRSAVGVDWPEADWLVCGNQRQETDIRRSRRPAAQDALILVKSVIKNKIDVGDRLANGGSYGPRQPLSLSP
jgi:hypothetical protein